MVGIRHATTKTDGQTGFSSEWNADHVIGAGSIPAGSFAAGAIVDADVSAGAAINITKLLNGVGVQKLVTVGGVPTWLSPNSTYVNLASDTASLSAAAWHTILTTTLTTNGFPILAIGQLTVNGGGTAAAPNCTLGISPLGNWGTNMVIPASQDTGFTFVSPILPSVAQTLSLTLNLYNNGAATMKVRGVTAAVNVTYLSAVELI
jgi:hypothetical protein